MNHRPNLYAACLMAYLLCNISFAQAQSQIDKYFDLSRKHFQKEQAYKTTAFVEKYFRLPGNEGFNLSIYEVERHLKLAGFKEDPEEKTDLSYRIEKRAMKAPTWEPVDAGIYLNGAQEALQVFSSNRNMIPINSISTPDNGVEAEMVYLEAGKKIEDLELNGKILFAESHPSALLKKAEAQGAIGVLGYAMPHYTKPEINQNSIQFSRVANNAKAWALLLSYRSKEALKAAAKQGKNRLKVYIKTKSYNSEELTIIANIKGKEMPQERFVYSAHVQEPGANDNASGVGVLTELARSMAEIYKQGKFKPNRSVTFLWGDEITSTARYISEDSTRAKGIRWGMSLDMVGEDTQKTGGSFLVEKMPDPSAIWTRGADKHSEWGAGRVQEKDFLAHYFNDFIIDLSQRQGKFANWEVNTNPYEGGSDHTPFIRNKIPGLLLWHFTDQFYHTDQDRLDKVSKSTLENVGVTALTTAMVLSSASENTALELLSIVKKAAAARMAAEYALSADALKAGKVLKDELHILEQWQQWYLKAIKTPEDMTGTSNWKKLKPAQEKAAQEFLNLSSDYINRLKK